jgi:uncharacterized repeat protein (TIGR03803 family)
MPYASLVADARGSLYGTTLAGGNAACHCGTIFQATPTSGRLVERVLYSFNGGSDGATPISDIVVDASGALYGTTLKGGSSCQCGTVFALTPHGSTYAEQVLYRFKGGSDGSFPKGGVVFGADGALYGTTSAGASGNDGTVFRLTGATSGYQETIVFAFGNGQGSQPLGDLLVRGTALYGVTAAGGASGLGTVYRLTPSDPSYSEHLLYSFEFGASGSTPTSGLVAGPHGVFFGTTAQGGLVSTSNDGTGVVYQLTPAAAGFVEREIVAAYNPVGLTVDAGGTVYFATVNGGYGSQRCGYLGCGTLLALTGSSGNYRQTTVHDFAGGANGAKPQAGPILSNGVLYGTTSRGGLSTPRQCLVKSPSQPTGCGTIFAIKP